MVERRDETEGKERTKACLFMHLIVFSASHVCWDEVGGRRERREERREFIPLVFITLACCVPRRTGESSSPLLLVYVLSIVVTYNATSEAPLASAAYWNSILMGSC